MQGKRFKRGDFVRLSECRSSYERVHWGVVLGSAGVRGKVLVRLLHMKTRGATCLHRVGEIVYVEVRFLEKVERLPVEVIERVLREV